LAHVPGVASVGEVHNLTDNKAPRGAQWGGAVCGRCGGDCPVFTPQFRYSSLSPGNLYTRIADQYGRDTLVISDKTPDLYRRFIKPSELDAVFIFKHPASLVASDRRHNPDKTLQQTLDEWTGYVPTVYTWCKQSCRSFVSVCLEDLAADPQGVMDRLCDALRLPRIEVPEDLNQIEYHHIVGNAAAHKSTRIFLDDRWKTELDPETLATVRENKKAMLLYEAWRRESV
jgi:hypothetical protein